jgi:hypothetical protein
MIKRISRILVASRGPEAKCRICNFGFFHTRCAEGSTTAKNAENQI